MVPSRWSFIGVPLGGTCVRCKMVGCVVSFRLCFSWCCSGPGSMLRAGVCPGHTEAVAVRSAGDVPICCDEPPRVLLLSRGCPTLSKSSTSPYRSHRAVSIPWRVLAGQGASRSGRDGRGSLWRVGSPRACLPGLAACRVALYARELAGASQGLGTMVPPGITISYCGVTQLAFWFTMYSSNPGSGL